MAPKVRRPLSVTGALLGCALVSPGAAASEREAMHLDYTAPPGCIDAATFRARLESLPKSTGASAKGGDRITIAIEANDGSFTGRLHLLHSDGTVTDRSVASDRCEDVSEALEFVAALALGLNYTPPARPTAVAAAPPLPPRVVPTAAPTKGRSRWRGLVALRGALLTGVGPNFELAPDLAFGVMLDAAGVVAPSFELSGTWATSGQISKSVGDASLTLWGGAAAVCPVRFLLGGGFGVRPCADFSAGALSGSATGAGVTPGPAQVVPWVAAGVSLRIEWRLNDFFAIELEGGPNYEFLRSRIYFQPSRADFSQTDVYRGPTVGSATKLGLEVLWP